MATNQIIPDLLYAKQREATLPYEDARFNSLLASVPDYYPSPTDFTLTGCFLRSLAMEMARFEYMYAYDMVGLEPQYLTPPDIRRRWASPLFISKSYPASSPSDIDYKTMLVNLLQAYPLGATVAAINAVISAYTGKAIVVTELYKLIGNGIYDDSDRNTLKLSLNLSATGNNPFSELVSAATLANLAEDLYAAIDIAKPAHIGLDYTVTFGTGEDMRLWTHARTLTAAQWVGQTASIQAIYTAEYDLVTAATGLTSPITLTQWSALSSTNQAHYALTYRINGGHGIDDKLKIVYNGIEPAPLPDIFTLAPIDPKSGLPTTTLTPQGEGVLAPLKEKCWSIKSDVLKIYRMS
jgi:hypothetical protein